jgi:hypothetical protein
MKLMGTSNISSYVSASIVWSSNLRKSVIFSMVAFVKASLMQDRLRTLSTICVNAVLEAVLVSIIGVVLAEGDELLVEDDVLVDMF